MSYVWRQSCDSRALRQFDVKCVGGNRWLCPLMMITVFCTSRYHYPHCYHCCHVQNNNTTLHAACRGGHIELVKVLLSHGVDVDWKNWVRDWAMLSPWAHKLAHGCRTLMFA